MRNATLAARCRARGRRPPEQDPALTSETGVVAEPFAWGIVGTGAIARQFAADLAFLPGVRISAVCSRDRGRAQAFAASVGAESAWSDLDAMLAGAGIDALYVATPNTLHAGQALRAIAHGTPVLVEKPLAASAAEAERIADEAARSGSFVMEGLWTRFLPAVAAARRMVEEGAVGEIRTIRAELSYFHREDEQNRLFRWDLGGGAALDLGVYPLSLALHFLGQPTSVTGSSVRAKTGVDRRSEFRLGFRRAEAILSCGFDRDGDNRFVIEGSEGVLRLESPFLKAKRLTRFTPRAFALAGKTPGGGLAGRIAGRLPFPGRTARAYPFPGGGLQFEAVAVMEAVRRGERGCAAMPLADSVAVLGIIDHVLSVSA